MKLICRLAYFLDGQGIEIFKKARRIRIETLRNDNVKLNFQLLIDKKLRDIDETVQSEIVMMWSHEDLIIKACHRCILL